MTRGLGGHSPANLSYHLKGVDFPATREDLLRQVRANDADPDVVEVVESMPQQEYQSMAEVMAAYGDIAARNHARG